MPRLLTALCLTLTVASLATASSLEQLQTSFMSRYDEANAERDQNLRKLEASYLGALQRHMDKVKASGKLERVIPVRDEIEAIETGADPLPALPKNADGDLGKMRDKYAEARDRILKNHAETLVDLAAKMDQALMKEEADLTRAGKIDDALAAKRMRETLSNDAGITTARKLLDRGGDSGSVRLGEWRSLLAEKIEVMGRGKYPAGRLSEILPEEREFWRDHFKALSEEEQENVLVSPAPCQIRFKLPQAVNRFRGKVSLASAYGDATAIVKAGGVEIFRKRLNRESRGASLNLEFDATKVLEFEVDMNSHPGADWICWTAIEVR
ncbi:hypothetical protein [Haloferula sp. A504]|uniref:hypothetical protein n=1 Tax=Haloferula sp. A504 TaxID=3373601 RepID=UPI0031BCB3D4|nr:hypothetical protein [Verrucomicrobiaceae bacterium E54]